MYSTDVCAVCYRAMENISPQPFSLCFQIYSAASPGFFFLTLQNLAATLACTSLMNEANCFQFPFVCQEYSHTSPYSTFIGKWTQNRFIPKIWPLYGQFHFRQHMNSGRKGKTFGKPWSGYTGIRAGKTQTIHSESTSFSPLKPSSNV